ncbi:MAG: tetratricopeptide repeat protein [Lachnospiraceae bacterium]|nr:tetratricopeptide repeat protein [Lachnospiraceae bacterium]
MLKRTKGKKIRLMSIIFCSMTVSVLLGGCKGSPLSKKEEYRNQGITAVAQGRYMDAVVSFEAALKESNGIVKDIDYDISYYLALAEYKAGNHEEAYNIYSAIIGMDDERADAYYLRGKVSLYDGKKEEADKDFNKAVELTKTDHKLYERIYKDLEACGYKDDGVSYIKRAMENDKKISDYQNGVYSYYLGNYDDARNYLEKARGKNDNAELVAYLGKTYSKLGDSGYAASLFETYLGANPDDAEIYNELGLIRLQLKDYSGALTAFTRGMETNDEAYMQSLKYNEIVTYEYMNDFETAKAKMAEYLNTYPVDEKAQRENIFLSTR